MATTTERLERIRNRATLYELAAIHPDGRRILVAYCGGRSRSFALRTVRQRGEKIVALCQADSVTFGKRSVDGMTCGDWSIRFTGRTQREAIVEGELPFIGDL